MRRNSRRVAIMTDANDETISPTRRSSRARKPREASPEPLQRERVCVSKKRMTKIKRTSVTKHTSRVTTHIKSKGMIIRVRKPSAVHTSKNQIAISVKHNGRTLSTVFMPSEKKGFTGVSKSSSVAHDAENSASKLDSDEDVNDNVDDGENDDVDAVKITSESGEETLRQEGVVERDDDSLVKNEHVKVEASDNASSNDVCEPVCGTAKVKLSDCVEASQITKQFDARETAEIHNDDDGDAEAEANDAEAYGDGTEQLDEPDESIAQLWTKTETNALVEFVSRNGLSAWDKLSKDSTLSERHNNAEACEQRFNLLFGLASGTIKPEANFNVIRQPGLAQFTNPYVREYMSRYYPNHMNRLRQQYQQYAYQYARQMVQRPQYYSHPHNTQEFSSYNGAVDEEVSEKEEEEEYVSELSGSEDTSDSEQSSEQAYDSSDDINNEPESDSDYVGEVSKKKKTGRKRATQPKFVEYQPPAGSRSSGRVRALGNTRKSYTYDDTEYLDFEEPSDAESEPDERIDRVLACRESNEGEHAHRVDNGNVQNIKSKGKAKSNSSSNASVTEYLIKQDGTSYIHCKWLSMKVIQELYARPGVDKVKRWLSKRYDVEADNAANWGGEPFNPNFTTVEKVIATQWVASPSDTLNRKVEMFLVKWKDLSYAETTWETRVDVDDESKIAEFEKFNSRPNVDSEQEQPKIEATPALIAEWHKESPLYKNGNSLRDYQLQGVNWLIKSHHLGRNTILADEMGLGKTIQSIGFLSHLLEVERIRGPFLVCVPLSTIGHWLSEFNMWTNMNVVLYHDNFRGKITRGLIREHEFYYSGSSDVKFHVLLTTYETVLSDITELSTISWQQLIIDEGHRLKNRNARLLSALQQLHGPPKTAANGTVTQQPPRRILLTGTPIQNSTEELWTLLNYIAPYEFYSIDDFMARFGDLKNHVQVEELQNAIRMYVLRRMKENVEKSIPPKKETIVDIELTTLQKTYYRAIFEKNRDFLGRGVNKSNVPRLINVEMELRKCCNHPWLIKGVEDKEVSQDAVDDEYVAKTIEASGKMVLLDKLLTKLHREGHRVLIFSQMRAVLDILAFYVDYKGYPYERLDGHTHGNARQSAIDRFSREGSDRFVFLLSTRAGGVGLNLTAADTVIIYDSDWNPQQDVQAQARVHRIGQQKNVSVYRLVTRNTYEAEMFQRASRKLGLDQAVLHSMQNENGSSGGNGMDAQDKKDLEMLLRRGAYGLMNDDDSAAKNFCEADVEDILAKHSRVVVHKGDKSSSGQLRGLQYEKMSFASAAADANIDLNDPDFWEKVLARERRPGEETACELLQLFSESVARAEGRTPECDMPVKQNESEQQNTSAEGSVVVDDSCEDAAAVVADDAVDADTVVAESLTVKRDITMATNDLCDKNNTNIRNDSEMSINENTGNNAIKDDAESSPDVTTAITNVTDDNAETEISPTEQTESTPKTARETRKINAARRLRQKNEAKAKAAEARAEKRAIAKASKEAEKKRKEETDKLSNFRAAKHRKNFLDTLRMKVQRTLSAKAAGEHINDLGDLLDLLDNLIALETLFSKADREEAMKWKSQLESRSRRRASGFEAMLDVDDAFDIDDDDDEDKPASRRAPTKGRRTPAKRRTAPNSKKTRQSPAKVTFKLDGSEVLSSNLVNASSDVSDGEMKSQDNAFQRGTPNKRRATKDLQGRAKNRRR